MLLLVEQALGLSSIIIPNFCQQKNAKKIRKESMFTF